MLHRLAQGSLYNFEMAFGTRLREARKRQRISQAQLGDAVGVTSQAVSQWERGETMPEMDKMTTIARRVRVPLNWLLDEPRGDPDEAIERVPMDDFERDGQVPAERGAPVGIVEIDVRAGMGGGGVPTEAYRPDGQHTDPLKSEGWSFPASFLREELRAPAARLIIVETQGDSMSPTIAPGERLVIDTAHRLPSPDGIYAIRDRYDAIVVKRLQMLRGYPRLKIISDNQNHPAEEVGLDEIEIVGRVVCGLKRF
jgi:transcriptional regulator with XRE-family HTH domain